MGFCALCLLAYADFAACQAPPLGLLGGGDHFENGSEARALRHKRVGFRQCPASRCESRDFIPPSIFGANDGPHPYHLFLPGRLGSGIASIEEMGSKYTDVAGFTSTRLDEAGRAFHLPCMFKVTNLDNIPDPSDDRNWDWADADWAFMALLSSGLAPMLKIPVNTWQSTRLAGLAYVDESERARVKITPSKYDSCEPWPTISGVIMARKNGTLVGTMLALKIAARYNDPSRFPVPGKLGVGALDRDAFEKGFGGIELMNEWSMWYCFPYGSFPEDACPPDDVVTKELWEQYCFGPPGTWGSRYWDAGPQEAWQFYAETAKAFRANEKLAKIRVGGPATATGTSFMPCMSYEGIGKDWVDGFLRTVKSAGAPLDFFSFHYYGTGQNQSADHFGHGQPTDMEGIYEGYLASLRDSGFSGTPMVMTEYNSPFILGDSVGFVGSTAGAAINAAKQVQFFGWPDFKAGFIYTGRDGAFAPWNPFSFPLGCAQVWSSNTEGCRAPTPSESLTRSEERAGPRQYAGCTPDDVLVPNETSPTGFAEIGTWSENCSTRELQNIRDLPGCLSANGAPTACQFGPYPESGMGTFYASGQTNPMGAMFKLVKSAAGSRKLTFREPYASTLRESGVYAFAWQPRPGRAMILLSNPFDTGVVGELPSAQQLLGPKVVGSLRGSMLLQTTFDGREVSGEEGPAAREPLVGRLTRYSDRFGHRFAWEPLPRLGPYDVVRLQVKYLGCSCPAAPEVNR